MFWPLVHSSNSPPQCGLDWATPQLFKVTQPHGAVDSSFTITGAGFGTQAAGQRSYFGWNSFIGFRLEQCKYYCNNSSFCDCRSLPELAIHADNGKTSVNGLTFHVTNGSTYNPLSLMWDQVRLIPRSKEVMLLQPQSLSQPRIVVVYP